MADVRYAGAPMSEIDRALALAKGVDAAFFAEQVTDGVIMMALAILLLGIEHRLGAKVVPDFVALLPLVRDDLEWPNESAS